MRRPAWVKPAATVASASFLLALAAPALLAGQAAAATRARAAFTPGEIWACFSNATGAARLIGPDVPCHHGESRVHWNIAGKSGPKGVTGAAGTNGTAGTPGAAGAPGAPGTAAARRGRQEQPARPGRAVAQQDRPA